MFDFKGIRDDVAKVFASFLDRVTSEYKDNIHSVHLIGSAITADYMPGKSDINSVFVLKEMDLDFLRLLAPLGKSFKKEGLSAPLIMTPQYIQSSLDVFPVEFLNFKLIHKTVLGEDILGALTVEKANLRLQVERELKSKLIWLRQGYLSTMGEKKALIENISTSITGFIPVFRAIIFLTGATPPVEKQAVIKKLQEHAELDSDIYEKMILIKENRLKPDKDELEELFRQYYKTTERLGRLIDVLEV
jgi:hypothetical protein